jgi:hypothetical protein
MVLLPTVGNLVNLEVFYRYICTCHKKGLLYPDHIK